MSVETLKVELANLSQTDAEFLKSVITMFTDPENQEIVEAFRDKKFAIAYGPAPKQNHFSNN